MSCLQVYSCVTNESFIADMSMTWFVATTLSLHLSLRLPALHSPWSHKVLCSLVLSPDSRFLCALLSLVSIHSSTSMIPLDDCSLSHFASILCYLWSWVLRALAHLQLQYVVPLILSCVKYLNLRYLTMRHNEHMTQFVIVPLSTIPVFISYFHHSVIVPSQVLLFPLFGGGRGCWKPISIEDGHYILL